MILWRSKERTVVLGPFTMVYRRVLEMEFWSIRLAAQFRQINDSYWTSTHASAYEVNIGKHFNWGFEHVYYDGPHCFLSLGWLNFCWNGNPRTGSCKKCMPDE